MRGLKIYLAGAMQGKSFEEMNGWRQNLKAKLVNRSHFIDSKFSLRVINPVDYYNFESVEYFSGKEVMQYDLNHVTSSDLVIVNINELNTSVGSVIEIYECHTRNIPVLAFGSKEDYEKLHPWIKQCISRLDYDVENLVDYIVNFYMK